MPERCWHETSSAAGRRAGPPQARPDPLGGSIAVRGDRGAVMTSPEPRFARIAAMIGDPTRARMLAALMGGQYLAAGELAAAAGVSAQTASTHITKLLDSELVELRIQ